MGYGFKIIVEGDYACFTRPEMKVERVSYDVPTPSALEGLIKCIYWKPAIKIIIDQIIVFNPIHFINIRRNEVKEKVLLSNVKSEMTQAGKSAIIHVHNNKNINQRGSCLLKDVKYGVSFHFEMTGIKSEDPQDNVEKHYNIMLRRLKKGQCFRTPYLGTREFSVSKVELVEQFNDEEISPALRGTKELGYMLYGMQFEDRGIPLNKDWQSPRFSDRATPLFYKPIMINGIIEVQRYREGLRC